MNKRYWAWVDLALGLPAYLNSPSTPLALVFTGELLLSSHFPGVTVAIAQTMSGSSDIYYPSAEKLKSINFLNPKNSAENSSGGNLTWTSQFGVFCLESLLIYTEARREFLVQIKLLKKLAILCEEKN